MDLSNKPPLSNNLDTTMALEVNQVVGNLFYVDAQPFKSVCFCFDVMFFVLICHELAKWNYDVYPKFITMMIMGRYV